MKKIIVSVCFCFASIMLYSQSAEELYGQAEAMDHSKKEDAKKAITLLTKAVEQDPSYKLALELRASIYELQGMYKEEITDLTTLITMDSTYAGYYKTRANAYKLKSELEKAISDYTKAYALDTSMIECIYQRGKIYGDYFSSKKYQKALDDFDFCISHATISVKADAYVGRGRVYENQEEFEKAISDYNTALKVNPLCKEAYLYRGILKLALNQDGCYDLLKYREIGGADAQDYLNKYCYK